MRKQPLFLTSILFSSLSLYATTTGPLSCTVPSNFPATSNTTGTFSCPTFDTGLGTLNSITLNFEGSLTGSVGVVNMTLANRTVTGTVTGTFDLDPNGQLPGFLFSNSVGSAVFSFGPVTYYTGNYFIPISGSTTGPLSFVNSTQLDPLYQAPNSSFAVNVLPKMTLTAFNVDPGSSSVIVNSLGRATATLSVVYDYTDGPVVPEPGSIGMGLAGLATFAYWKRRS